MLEMFDYSPVTGELYWKQDSNPRYPRWPHKAGDVAGKIGADDYLLVYFDRFAWRTHRIIWLIMTGEDPIGFEIDHRNGVGWHNGWHNLRKATRSQQLTNRRRPRNNKSGVKGVYQRSDGKWVATISMNGKGYWLGAFPTMEEAVLARRTAEERLHGEYSANGRGNYV